MAIAPGHPEPTIASDEQRRRSARLLVLDERSRLRLFAQLPAHMRVGRQREAERPLVGTAQFTREQARGISFAALPLCHRSKREPTAPRDARCSSGARVARAVVDTLASLAEAGVGPPRRGTSRALKRSRARRRRNESRLPPVGRCFRRAERAGAARRTWAASDPTRDRGSCCVWSAGRGEDVVAGLLAAAAGSGADATVVVVLGVPVTLLARQAAAQAWIVARRTPTSPAVWRVTMRPAAARRHQRNRG
jgi:hypothetical protein